MGGDTGALTDGPDAFLGGGLDPDGFHRDLQRFGELFFHALQIGGDLGLLGDQGGVDVHQPVPEAARLLHGPAEDDLGGDALDGRIGIGKVVTDIVEATGPEDGIGNGVTEHIGIRVADQADLGEERHAAQNQRESSLQAVDVVAVADAERGVGWIVHAGFGEKGFQEGEIGGTGQFWIGKNRFDEDDPLAKSFHGGEIVGHGVVEAGMGPLNQLARKGLWRFHGPELFAGEEGSLGRGFERIATKLADGIADAVSQGDRASHSQQAFSHGLQGGWGNGRSGTIVYIDPIRFGGQQVQPLADRDLPLGAAQRKKGRHGDPRFLHDRCQLLALYIVPGHDDEGIDDTRFLESLHDVGKNGPASHLEEDLILDGVAHPGSGSAGQENCHVLHANTFDFPGPGKQISNRMPPEIQSLTLACPAKINLSLAILGRRGDGFHELHSVVAQVSVGDELSLRWNPAGSPAEDTLRIEGAPLPSGENSVMRAIELFRRVTGLQTGSFSLALAKRIPVGAGLGGGSSDAVGVLKALQQIAPAGLPAPDWLELAAQLGSDCPLFLHPGPVVMAGRGERISSLEPALAERLSGRRVLLFKPRFSVGTPEAYRRLASLGLYQEAGVGERLLQAWRSSGDPLPARLNDFERLMETWMPSLAIVLKRLRQIHGLEARLSGSGSACFVFPPEGACARPAVSEESVRAWGETCWMEEANLY